LFRQEAEKLRAPTDKTKAFTDALTEAQVEWTKRGNADDARKNDLLDKLYKLGLAMRDSNGNLQPRRDMKLSGYSRLPTDQPFAEALRDTNSGESVMPAENTAYLGRTLFTDYLLSVELGGTLLLVAAIGAIAIAGRHREGTLP